MQGKVLNTGQAYLQEYKQKIKYVSMTQDQSKLFITLMTSKDNAKLIEEVNEYINQCQSCLIMKKRFEMLNINASNELLAMLSSMIDRPGFAVLSVIDIMNVLDGSKEATFEHFTKAYPIGYYDVSDEQMMRNIIDLCKDRKINFSEIY